MKRLIMTSTASLSNVCKQIADFIFSVNVVGIGVVFDTVDDEEEVDVNEVDEVPANALIGGDVINGVEV